MEGRRLRQLRKAAGLNQPQLAVAAGLSLSTVTDIEQGIVTDPKLSTLQALARALEVDLTDLLSEPEAEDVPEVEVEDVPEVEPAPAEAVGL